ncbi:chromosome transmission fidelity protein 18 homolog isoform X2 [Prunus avium]|uniref:Chromosome transmission fidelity protein 18 homolog n=1 Tax=Prunus avium TaxID=42229 RepID=A0A6P5T736_PRUAV|nr:chromosome transmission fidelity protein 18 homolog isoform X2 [Prunus avium]
MDIPFPEELELLEANYHLPEDSLLLEAAEPCPEEFEKEQPTRSKWPPSTDHPSSSETQSNAHNRLRSSGMDMDIPFPEELELLEANYHLHEDLLDLEPAEPYQEEYEKEQSPSTDHPSSSETQINGHKRSRSLDGPYGSISENDGLSDEKRSKIDDLDRSKNDVDWLQYSPPHQSDPTVDEQVVDAVEEKVVSRYASEIHGDFIPVTAPGAGDRVYAKICRIERVERPKILRATGKFGGLISEPIKDLLQRVEQEAFMKALPARSKSQGDVIHPETPVVHEQLWVDKYAPNSFTELLSDELTNREVLLWLKQWDPCVFGSEIRSTSDDVLSALRRHSSITQHKKLSDSKVPRNNRGSRWDNGKSKHFNDMNNENTNSKSIKELWNRSRSSGPPEEKILLLCGPPGLGKTTLAHVAAKHCGYRVVEVSADRKFDTEKDNVNKELKLGRFSSKRGRKTASLSRPVICICNDLYAPALRPLRRVAKVHVFVQPTVSRVVSRLKYICTKEEMKTSSIALTALAGYTECDIRSCLNTLQFLNKKKETLNAWGIDSQVVGRKDMSRSVFDVWKEIFQKRKTKIDRRTNRSCGIMSNEFDSLHSLISNCGDYDLIVDGLHENFLHLPYHDPVMQKTVKCLNSLGASDLMHKYIMRTQHVPLYAYLPAIAITVHRLVAQVQRPNIEWPKSYHRYRTMLMEKVESLRSWYSTVPPFISRHLSIKSFVEDSISFLLHILSPPTLRPVASHLLSEMEKNDLAQLVSTMVSYSITHRSMKSNTLPSNLGHEAAGASALSFDPPIGDFINFKGYISGHHVLALTMKEVLAHEVEKQRILQVSTGRSAHSTVGCNKENQDLLGTEISSLQSARADHAGAGALNAGNSENMSNGRQPSPSTSSVSLNLGSAKITKASTKLNSPGCMRSPNGSSSFFDRFRKLSTGSQNTDDSVQKEATSERDLRPLVFKFNEGFTNAVKRPVRIREFLL